MKSYESKSGYIFSQAALSCAATIFALSACSSLPAPNVAAKSEYKSAVSSCSELTGVEHSMCIQDANADMDTTVKSVYKAALSAAEADYQAAIVKCKEQPVDVRNDCFKTADSVKTAAIVKAQSARRATISVEKKSIAE